MACIVRGSVPAEEFALHEGLTSLPDAEFEVERIVTSGDETVMPLMWVRGADHEAVEAAFEADPSVRNLSLLAEFEDEQLYRMEWTTDIEVVLQMLTNSEAAVTDAYGAEGRWQLRIFYPRRDALTETTDFVERNGFTFDVEAIHQFDGEPSGRYGLTEKQFEALQVAGEEGYFEVPRGITQEALADELDISHQALSERLRRSIGALVEDTVLIGTAENQAQERE